MDQDDRDETKPTGVVDCSCEHCGYLMLRHGPAKWGEPIMNERLTEEQAGFESEPNICPKTGGGEEVGDK